MFSNFCLWILLIFSSLGATVEQNAPKAPDKFKVHFMEANSIYNFKPFKSGFFEKHLNTYCYSGEPKSLGRLLESVELVLEIEDDDYTQYDGTTPYEVEEHYQEHRSLFSFNLFTQKRSRLSLSPFGQQCIGIETAVQTYKVRLLRQNVDYIRAIMLFSGITVFLFAGILSRNSLFFYVTGIVFGICSSFLLLIWLSGKLMPRRAMMYGVLIGGWTVGFYVLRMLWDNLQMIMMTYRSYVCWYIVITGLISFFLCYHWGPPKNKRSKNIIKWLLQLMSSTIIYFSSNFKEAIIAVILMTFILYYFPRVLRDIMSFRGEKSTQVNSEAKRQCSSPLKKNLRDECNEWRLNSSQNKEWKIKLKSGTRSINNSRRSLLGSRSNLPSEEAKQLGDSSSDVEENHSESDISFNEDNVTKQKLYPLPDGSFLLSETRPIIITPRHGTPIYHRSSPLVNGEVATGADEDDHTHHMPLPAHTRRLTAASSTSELFVKSRLNTPSPHQVQRSSSAQRSVPSRSMKMLSSAKKTHSSNPKIKIVKADSDEGEG
ncbi:nuclear envelope integral membrane protein [Stomoxys calcitrans]|uniref:nuclear envelope integral membrane protein n=1 Tax=Stomoxys calcitrans TaxID=35570 RepID=UPI0027E27E9F|nr:nuclear envelope integral membrane protein [Stomoxys calcitrans]